MSRWVSDLGKSLFTLTLSRHACILSKRWGIRSKPSDQVCIMTAGAPCQGKHTTAMHPEQIAMQHCSQSQHITPQHCSSAVKASTPQPQPTHYIEYPTSSPTAHLPIRMQSTAAANTPHLISIIISHSPSFSCRLATSHSMGFVKGPRPHRLGQTTIRWGRFEICPRPLLAQLGVQHNELDMHMV